MPVDISQTGSQFLELIGELEAWYSRLPDQFRVTDLNIYIQKELHNVGALYLMHLLYHVTVTDLTRISLPGYDFPLASALRSTLPAFRIQCQERCRYHADEIASLIRSGMSVGQRAFDSPHCAVAATESTKIQIIHAATSLQSTPATVTRAKENVQSNLAFLTSRYAPKEIGRAHV